MQNIKILSFHHAALDEILESAEQLLWSGMLGYGRRFLEAVGDERKFHVAAFIGCVVMWSTLPLIDAETRFSRNEAIWVYSAATLMLLGMSVSLAGDRQYVLNNLVD